MFFRRLIYLSANKRRQKQRVRAQSIVSNRSSGWPLASQAQDQAERSTAKLLKTRYKCINISESGREWRGAGQILIYGGRNGTGISRLSAGDFNSASDALDTSNGCAHCLTKISELMALFVSAFPPLICTYYNNKYALSRRGMCSSAIVFTTFWYKHWLNWKLHAWTLLY